MVKRKREEDGGSQLSSKKRKRTVRETPLRKFRKQTVARRRELQKIIRECNSELRAIIKDLGKLKRK